MGLFVDVLVIDFPDEFADSTGADEECPGTQPAREPIDEHFCADYASAVVQATSLHDLPGITTPFGGESCFESFLEKVIAGAPSVRTNTSWKIGFFVSVDASVCVSTLLSLGLPQHIVKHKCSPLGLIA
jgi:hypothetical protein